jgi:predicted esterase
MDNKGTYVRVLGLALLAAAIAGCGSPLREPPPTSVPPTVTPSGPEVNVVADVVFATPLDVKASQWELDIYAPQEAGDWPVVLITHGFLPANRKAYAELGTAIAQRGAVVFAFSWPAINEDMAMQENGRGIREMTETAACAVRFAKARARQYGGDPDRVTLSGHSFGGFLVVWLGLVQEDADTLWADYAATHGAPPAQVTCVETEPTPQVQAILGLAGGYNKWKVPRYWEAAPGLMAIADPYAHIGEPADVRVRLIHGENDNIVSPDVAMDLERALEDAGYDVELTLWDGGHSIPNELTVDKILEVSRG